MFSFFKKKNDKVGGLIDYFKLTDWWLSEFTDKEREFIIKTFQPLGGSNLVEGRIDYTGRTSIALLGTLASWFKKKEERNIGYRLLKKGEELLSTSSIVDQHFFLGYKLEYYYKFRNEDDFALQEAISACKQQIRISSLVRKPLLDELRLRSLPTHKGFEQLAIIEEKQQNYPQALTIAKQALEEGWYGEWNNRIERLEKKLSKLTKNS